MTMFRRVSTVHLVTDSNISIYYIDFGLGLQMLAIARNDSLFHVFEIRKWYQQFESLALTINFATQQGTLTTSCM